MQVVRRNPHSGVWNYSLRFKRVLTFLAMHLDIQLWMHNKNYVSGNPKLTYNLKRKEYITVLIMFHTISVNKYPDSSKRLI